MKKSLLALAALSAFATAQAQSNVTIYGAVGASSTSTETNNVQAANAFQGASQDYLGTTNLGLKGTEDLGGGLKAFFTLEGDLSMSGQLGSQASDDTQSGTAANANNNIFNRQAHVGIESKQYGTVSVGRQNDSIKDLEGLGQVYNLSDNLHMNTQVGDRYAQIIKYATPTLNGFKATYSYTNNAGNTGSSTDQTVNTTADGAKTLNSFALSYAYQNYNFGVGKGTIRDLSVTNDVETTFVGARATFGNLTVGAHQAMNEQGANELDQTMVSVNYTMGKVDLKAHYVKNDLTGSTIGTAGVGTSDGKGYGVMGVYNLSKRTSAYVGYAKFDQTDASTYDANTTTVGVFHKF